MVDLLRTEPPYLTMLNLVNKGCRYKYRRTQKIGEPRTPLSWEALLTQKYTPLPNVTTSNLGILRQMVYV